MARNFQLDFIEATDDKTAQDELVYTAYTSSNSITSVSELSSATQIKQVTGEQLDTSPLQIEIENQDQYLTVAVKDKANNTSLYNSVFIEEVVVTQPVTEKPVVTNINEFQTEISVSFTGVDNATSYQYRISSGPSNTVPGNPFTVDGFEPNTPNNIQIRGLNSEGAGPWSDPVSFTTLQISPPTEAPTVTVGSINLTGVSVTATSVNRGERVEYRLDGGVAVDAGTSTVFTIGSLSQNTTYDLEVRWINDGGSGPWSSITTFTTDAEITNQPIIDSVENTEDPVSISFTGVDFASGYDYRINSGVAIDIGTTNPFTLVLDEGLEYTLEIRGKNEYGNGPWSAVTTFTTDYTNPTISDSSVGLSVNDTNQTYTVSWTKATDNVTATADLEYFLVETNVDETTTITEVLEMTPKATGVDVSQFTIQSFENFSSIVFIYVKDEAGNTSFYQAVDVFVSGPEVSDVEIYDQDPTIFTEEVPLSSFQNSGSLDLSSEQGSVRLYADVAAFNGADDTVTWSTSDASKVSITVIDDYTVDINYVSSEAGDVITITATSDFDSFFKASVDVALFADTSVANTESTTFELQT